MSVTQDPLNKIAQELERRKLEHGRQRFSSARLRRRLLRLSIWLSSIICGVMALFFFGNFITLNRHLIDGHIQQGLLPVLTQGKFTLSVEKIEGNIIHGVTLKNLILRNPAFTEGGALLAIPKVELQYSLLDSLLGSLVLHKVHIVHPVLTLTRSSEGIAVWEMSASATAMQEISRNDTDTGSGVSAGATADVGTGAGAGAASGAISGAGTSSRPRRRPTNRWLEAQRTQVLADRFLSGLEIENLTVLLPNPWELFADRFVPQTLGIPSATMQISNLNAKVVRAGHLSTWVLKVFPEHERDLFSVVFAENRAQKSNTLRLEVFNRPVEIKIEDAQDGLHPVQVLDGGGNCIDLSFLWDPSAFRWFRGIYGLRGHILLDNLGVLNRLLPTSTKIGVGGSFRADFAGTEKQRILDGQLTLSLQRGFLRFQEDMLVEDFCMELDGASPFFALRTLAWRSAGFPVVCSGSLLLPDRATLGVQLVGEIAGEELLLVASQTRPAFGRHKYSMVLQRHGAELNCAATRVLRQGRMITEDPEIELDVAATGRLSKIIPWHLLPPHFRGNTICPGIDLGGPLSAKLIGSSTNFLRDGTAQVQLDGARIIHQIASCSDIPLSGALFIGGRKLTVASLGLNLDGLQIHGSGTAYYDMSSRQLDSASFDLSGQLAEAIPGWSPKSLEPWLSPKEALPTPLSCMSLRGNRIFQAHFSTADATQTVKLEPASIDFSFPDGIVSILAPQVVFEGFGRVAPGTFPARLGVAVAGKIAGNSVQGSGVAKPAEQTWEKFDLKFYGEQPDNLAKLVIGLLGKANHRQTRQETHIAGRFNGFLTGSGAFARPELSGKIEFPALDLRYKQVRARVPLAVSVHSPVAGQITSGFSIARGQLLYQTEEIPITAANGELTWIARQAQQATSRLDGHGQIRVFDIDTSARVSVDVTTGRVIQAKTTCSASDLGPALAFIQRVGRMAWPLKASGKAILDWQGSTSGKVFEHGGTLCAENLTLKIPIPGKNQTTSLFPLDNLQGKIRFQSGSSDSLTVESFSATADILGGHATFAGAGNVRRMERSIVPTISSLTIDIDALPTPRLAEFLRTDLGMNDDFEAFHEIRGALDGRLNLQGNHHKMTAQGEIRWSNGALRYSGLSTPFTEVDCTLGFARSVSGQTDRIQLRDVGFNINRSKFKIPFGELVDPLGVPRLSLQGNLLGAYPNDILAFLRGLNLPRVHFPQEGLITGEVRVAGALNDLHSELACNWERMRLAWQTDGTTYQIPLGESFLALKFRPADGSIMVQKADLGLLGGRILLDQAVGRIIDGVPSEFKANGAFRDIDLGSLQTDETPALVKGQASGFFHAHKTVDGRQNADFHLDLKNLRIARLPLDQELLDSIGMPFVEKPDFATGSLNLYVTSEEDKLFQGKLRVADGLFAGPHLRLEIENSSFDPYRLELAGRLSFNPQSMRQTKLGQKLGKASVVVQDRHTGVPYIDLTVSGTWDNPGLLAKSIKRQAEQRGKRNYIRRIFGVHRAHKANVQELMEWFPGWRPGMTVQGEDIQ